MTQDSAPSIDIGTQERNIVRGLLRRHLPDVAVWAYGSRVQWNARDQSDLDLVAFAPSEQRKAVLRLREAFQESALPFSVDLLIWDDLPESFHRNIEDEYVVLQSAKEENVNSEWREVTLGEIAQLNNAAYSPQEEWRFVNYLDTGNITENRISEIQHLVAGTDKIPSRARRKVNPGDIVYSTVRPNQRHFGLIRDVPDNFLASTGFAVIRGKEDVACTDFIYWFLAQNHIVEYLHSIAENSTSAYPSIRPGDLEQLVLSLPSLPEQRAIAHILGTLDDKIELNRQINQTLEEMSRAIFQDWFVDFGPVRAKMEGREPYLPPELWELFPDDIVDSQLGQIPKGWQSGFLSDMVDIHSGGTPRTTMPDYWGGEIPWYTPKDAPNPSDIFALKTERSITIAGVENSSTKVLPYGTTIISARGTVGQLACLGVPMAMNQTCYGIRGGEGYPNHFTYWNLRNAVHGLQARTHGTVFETITRETFKAIETAIVPMPLAKSFQFTVAPYMDQILHNLRESNTLAAQRNTLLPQLMSGNYSTAIK